MVVEIRGEDQLVNICLAQEMCELLLNGIRTADSSDTQSGFHKEPLRFAPEAVHTVDGGWYEDRLATKLIQVSLKCRGCEPPCFLVRFCRHQRYARRHIWLDICATAG